MRSLAGSTLILCGLALAMAAAVRADDAAPMAGNSAIPQNSQVSGHHHQGLLGWRHCVECQRAMAKKRDGVDVPPPPMTAAGAAMGGALVHEHPQGVPCAACQAGTVVSGPVTVVESYPPGQAVVSGPVSVVESYPPGRAVVGGPVMAGNLPPGYAVVGGGPAMAGADPTPVGVSRAVQAQWNNPRLASLPPRPGAGSYDPSVRTSSAVPAQTALDIQTTNRPHILSHLFGFGGISRHIREERESKSREAHASIAYDAPSQPVNELPASSVYGKGH